MKISLFLKIALFINENNRKRVLRFKNSDGPFGPAVGGFYIYIWPPLLIKPYNRALGARENMPTKLRLMEMHPFCLRHLPRRGRFALHSTFAPHNKLIA